uniref:Guanylate cyclase soluble subunit alpha-3 n=1 Tax=Lygus hesperus TaxID=30085 RepID=A0A0A9XG10_LYGHE
MHCRSAVSSDSANEVATGEEKQSEERAEAWMEAIHNTVTSKLLPYLPTRDTKRCELCVRHVVAATATRHQQKLLRMEEARRFPTLSAAGKLTSLASVQTLLGEASFENAEQLLLARHPNKDYFKRPIKQAFRDIVKSYKDDVEHRLGKLKSTLEHLNSKAEQ